MATLSGAVVLALAFIIGAQACTEKALTLEEPYFHAKAKNEKKALQLNEVVILRVKPLDDALKGPILDWDDGASSPTKIRMELAKKSASSAQLKVVVTQGSGATAKKSTFTSKGEVFKVGTWVTLRMKLSNTVKPVEVYVDGTKDDGSTDAALPKQLGTLSQATTTKLHLGFSVDGSERFGGIISRVSILQAVCSEVKIKEVEAAMVMKSPQFPQVCKRHATSTVTSPSDIDAGKVALEVGGAMMIGFGATIEKLGNGMKMLFFNKGSSMGSGRFMWFGQHSDTAKAEFKFLTWDYSWKGVVTTEDALKPFKTRALWLVKIAKDGKISVAKNGKELGVTAFGSSVASHLPLPVDFTNMYVGKNPFVNTEAFSGKIDYMAVAVGEKCTEKDAAKPQKKDSNLNSAVHMNSRTMVMATFAAALGMLL